MLNIAAFGSGRGSNFEAILTAIQQRAIRGARICLVVGNNSKCRYSGDCTGECLANGTLEPKAVRQ